MTRTLITGVRGFTGSYLAERLRADGREVHGLVHEDGGAVPGVHACHAGNLNDLASLQRVVAEVRPDEVVHLAAISNVTHDDVAEIYQTNIVGTRNLLQALAASEHRPSAVLLASSAQIYDRRCEGVLTEAAPTVPANDYGVSKLASEHVARLYQDRLPIIVARPFNYTGPGQTENFLIPKIVAHARRRQPVIELGNLDVARDFSDVRRVVDAYARLLQAPKAIGQTVNVCSGVATTLREVLDLVIELSGHPIEVRINPAFVRANEVRTLLGSTAYLEELIGPVKTIPLEATLRLMLDS